MLFMVLLSVVILCTVDVGVVYNESYSWWRTLFGAAFVVIGIFTGRISYEVIFEK